jgi:uncharacterized protein YcbK (DUF882 family)
MMMARHAPFQSELEKTAHIDPQHASLSPTTQPNLTTNQRNMLAMQQTRGNHAVLRMMADRAMAQRAPQVGWNTRGGKPTTSINQGETSVPVDQANPALGASRRIPVRGLKRGSRLDDRDGIDWLGKKVSDITKEKADEGQAIVVIPDNLDVKQSVGVLLHLQGLTVGYRSVGGKVEDVDYARIEQQLRASGRNMIAILPQAGLPATKPSSPQFGNIDREQYIQDVFDFLTAEKLWTTTPQATPPNPTRGALVLSGYSGGGFDATRRLEYDATNKAGNLNPTKMAGVILFDAIHNKGQLGQVTGWLAAQMNNDLRALQTLATSITDPIQRTNAQLQYLEASMRFRGIHTTKSYKFWYEQVGTMINEWFTNASSAQRQQNVELSAIMSPAVITRFTNNYQVINSGHTDHATVIGQGDQLKNALVDLPNTVGQTPVAQQPAGTVQPSRNTAVQRQPAPKDQEGSTGNTGAKQAAPTVEQQLIDAAVQLAKSGVTRMQADYIRTQLQGRKSNAALTAQFDSLLAALTVQQSIPFVSDMAVDAAARELIKFMEGQFLHDPKASTLDFLAKGQSYRTKKWDRLDYPGNAEGEAAGPNEGTARQMMADLAGIEPERRPNIGSTAVLTESEFTSDEQLRKYVKDKLQSIPDLPAEEGKRKKAVSQSSHKLNATAQADFVRMRDAASKDNVDLIILSSYRSPETSKKASKGQNSFAIASYSSHNLGLAMDLQLSAGKQQYLETTTRPMQNIVDMHESPAHKWMFLHGKDYGWYPWHYEPWHWEYNPDGFRDKLQEDYKQWQVDNPPAPKKK